MEKNEETKQNNYREWLLYTMDNNRYRVTDRGNVVDLVKQNFEYDFGEIENIANITLNKLHEIERRFAQSGLDLYAGFDFNETTGKFNMPFSTGNAILDDIMCLYDYAVTLLEHSIDMIIDILGLKNRSIHNKIKLFINQWKFVFGVPVFPKKEREILEKNFAEYREICDYVSKYSLEKNLLGTLTNYLNNVLHRPYNIVIDEAFSRDLIPLGLDDILEDLRRIYSYQEESNPQKKEYKRSELLYAEKTILIEIMNALSKTGDIPLVLEYNQKLDTIMNGDDDLNQKIEKLLELYDEIPIEPISPIEDPKKMQ